MTKHPLFDLPFQDDTGNGASLGVALGGIQDFEAEHTDAHTGLQHIGFKIGKEDFMLPMTPVREIIMLPNITFVPKSSLSVEGIMSLRGEIMPVLNLRRMMAFSKGHATPTTRVIILQSEDGGFGIIVDEITDVVWLQPHEIESVSQNFFSNEYKMLAGVAKVGETMRGIVDVAKVLEHFSPVELTEVAS